MATLKEATDALMKDFNKYCESTNCDRICPSDRWINCLAQYVVRTNKLYDYEEVQEECQEENNK